MADAYRLGLTDEIRDQIATRLSSGCNLEQAAEASGVTRRVIQKWLATGREAETLEGGGGKITVKQRQCLDLLLAEKRARAEFRVKALASIQKAALGGTWQAAAWLLERTFPEDYTATKGGSARPNAGRPKAASSAPDRRPGNLRAVK